MRIEHHDIQDRESYRIFQIPLYHNICVCFVVDNLFLLFLSNNVLLLSCFEKMQNETLKANSMYSLHLFNINIHLRTATIVIVSV